MATFSLGQRRSSVRTADVADARVREKWPLVGLAAGLLGFVATMVGDMFPYTDGSTMLTQDVVGELDRWKAHLSVVTGFLTVALMMVVAATWRGAIETRFPDSTAARIVPTGLTTAAAALMLGYGWKGALAVYLPGGMDAGMVDEQGLFVYYMLNDFGSYIGWFGITVAASAVAWMALKERLFPIWLGVFSILPALSVALMTGITGLPGFPGIGGGIWMIVAFTTFAIIKLPARESTSANG